jgi:hypothetical protein
MNANEISDELDKFSELGGDVFFGMCADFVRQQQTEIERLSNDNYKFIKAMANKDSHIESLKQLLNDSALRKAQEK